MDNVSAVFSGKYTIKKTITNKDGMKKVNFFFPQINYETLEQKQKTPKENVQQKKKHVLYLPCSLKLQRGRTS